jgi:hypothetical protein
MRNNRRHPILNFIKEIGLEFIAEIIMEIIEAILDD